MTPSGIISRAQLISGVLGVGETASAEDTNTAQAFLQDIVNQWQRKRWLIFSLLDLFVLSTGAESYTVGPGGDIDTIRPDRLEAAYLRQNVPSQPSPVDYPLDILQSREDYSRIPLKKLGSFAQRIFYDSAYPLGSIFAWPIPNANIYEVHIIVKNQLDPIASLPQTLQLPPEYEAALVYNLAVRLRVAYQLPVDPGIVGLATDALNLIRNANAQIPRLTLPGRLTRPGGKYNIFGDYSYP